MVIPYINQKGREVFGGNSAGTEEFLEVTRPEQNSFYDVEFKKKIQNLITIFLLHQSFIQKFYNDHQGLCYYVLK